VSDGTNGLLTMLRLSREDCGELRAERDKLEKLGYEIAEERDEWKERAEHIAAEALAMAEQLEGQPSKRRFASVEEIKREFFPKLYAEEQREARERDEAEPSELPDPTPMNHPREEER
jgi:hypothetical protein